MACRPLLALIKAFLKGLLWKEFQREAILIILYTTTETASDMLHNLRSQWQRVRWDPVWKAGEKRDVRLEVFSLAPSRDEIVGFALASYHCALDAFRNVGSAGVGTSRIFLRFWTTRSVTTLALGMKMKLAEDISQCLSTALRPLLQPLGLRRRQHLPLHLSPQSRATRLRNKHATSTADKTGSWSRGRSPTPTCRLR